MHNLKALDDTLFFQIGKGVLPGKFDGLRHLFECPVEIVEALLPADVLCVHKCMGVSNSFIVALLTKNYRAMVHQNHR